MSTVEHYKELKAELGGASDVAVALLMVVEQLEIMNRRVVCLDGEQMGDIKKGLEGIAVALAGVGQMVGNLSCEGCAENVTNEPEKQ